MDVSHVEVDNDDVSSTTAVAYLHIGGDDRSQESKLARLPTFVLWAMGLAKSLPTTAASPLPGQTSASKFIGTVCK